MLDLRENAQAAIDDLIEIMGRATIEIVYHGRQGGRVAL